LYSDEQNNIRIKTVRMFTGLSAVEAVSKNEKGENIGFVKPGNNHHIAIYIDKEGKKQEHGCSFWHAVERKKYGIPVIIKNTKEVWNKVLENENEYPNSFLEKLPKDDWQFDLSLQQNEMIVLGMKQDEFEKAIKENNKSSLNQHLYRIQKIGSSDYWFRNHTETQLIDSEEARASKKYFRCKSIGAFEKLNPQKVRINNLGEIIND
jgi:CRISPR-associated endonuclease Csn1